MFIGGAGDETEPDMPDSARDGGPSIAVTSRAGRADDFWRTGLRILDSGYPVPSPVGEFGRRATSAGRRTGLRVRRGARSVAAMPCRHLRTICLVC